jgi:hypothetical protein
MSFRKDHFILIIIIIMSLFPGSILSQEGEQRVRPIEDALLWSVENSNRVFRRLEIGRIVSYFHQRKIGRTVVEKDFIRYKFDLDAGGLIEKKIRWRTDLPDKVEPVVTRAEAEGLAGGSIERSRLYIISPEASVFKIRPTPPNPCWVVWYNRDGRLIIVVVDAITGEKLGYGTPPPYAGLATCGFDPDTAGCDPVESWCIKAENAESWFEEMGYDTERIGTAGNADYQRHIQSDDTVMFYELNHGDSYYFDNQCGSRVTASETAFWITDYANVPFSFIASCNGMCDTGPGSFSHELRKGASKGTVTVGYCGMSSASGQCPDDCWDYAEDWQDKFLNELKRGVPAGWAFDMANLDYPGCGVNNCMRIAGDHDLRVVPVLTRSLCGDIGNGTNQPVYLEPGYRDHYIRCDIFSATSSIAIISGVTIRFLNDSKIINIDNNQEKIIIAHGTVAEIKFVSENGTKGIKLNTEMKIHNRGALKIYE